jgi:hypothetical protein
MLKQSKTLSLSIFLKRFVPKFLLKKLENDFFQKLQKKGTKFNIKRKEK